MTKTKFTEMVSVRIESYLLETMKKDVLKKKEEGLRNTTLSSLINDIIRKNYFTK